jgi:hypothetical protein
MARHFAECVILYGAPYLLSVCMMELMHTNYKSKVDTTSGRSTAVELLQHENWRLNSKHLWRVLQDLGSAASDPAVKRLPSNIRDALLAPENTSLRDQLRSRPHKSPYTATDLHPTSFDSSPVARPGPPVDEKEPLVLSDFETALLVRASGLDRSEVLARLMNGSARVKNVILPHRPARTGIIYADKASKGVAHYTVDAALCSTPGPAGIVQVESLFTLAGTVYAQVTWGTKGAKDPETGFWAYEFQAQPARLMEKANRSLEQHQTVLSRWRKCECVIQAERLVEYVYFGHVYAQGRAVPMLLHEYFIPH